MARKKKEQDPSSIVKGSHLTVITFADGRTELVWDDAKLEKEVREAIASVENKVLNSVEVSMEAIEKAKKSSKKGKKK